MLGRFAFPLAAAAIAASVSSLAPLTHADPQCPATGCPHGPSNANTPPPVSINSQSYKDGYKSEHDFYASPQNHAYLASEMKNGYTTITACQAEMSGGPVPANRNDWLAGCVDALHDLGFRP